MEFVLIILVVMLLFCLSILFGTNAISTMLNHLGVTRLHNTDLKENKQTKKYIQMSGEDAWNLTWIIAATFYYSYANMPNGEKKKQLSTLKNYLVSQITICSSHHFFQTLIALVIKSLSQKWIETILSK